MYIIYSVNVSTNEVVHRNTYNSLISAISNLENDVYNYVEIYKKQKCITVDRIPQKEGWYAIRNENSFQLYNNTIIVGWMSNTILSEKVLIFGILQIELEQSYTPIVANTPIIKSVKNIDFYKELSANLQNRRRDIGDDFSE